MPREIIGECGCSQERSEAVYETEVGIRYLKRVCGEPPPGMDLRVGWGESDSGEYPIIVLVWDDPMRGTPLEYIIKCHEALRTLESD
jgi:hypothetical protein